MSGQRWGRARVWILGACALGAVASIASASSECVDCLPGAREVSTIASLRSAADARARGDAAGAAQHFDQIAAQIPELIDHAGELAAQSWLDAKRAPEAEASARSALQQVPDSGIVADLYAALGRARDEQDDAAGARAAWREALARRPDDAVADALRSSLAASLVAANEIDAAAKEWLALWIGAAERAAGDEAGRRLDALEARAGHSFRSAAERVRRGDRLFEKQRTQSALDAYDAALAAGVQGADRTHALRRRADCLFRTRRYREAESAFGALGADPDARVWQARSMARAGRVDAAIEWLEAIGNESLGATSAWARYLAGLLVEGRGENERARALFAASVDGADEKVATQALWRLGWSAYTSGEMPTARRRLGALAAQYTDPLDRLTARYWAARAYEGVEPQEAERELAEIAAEYPFSYYGWRAASRAGAPAQRQSRAPIADGTAQLSARDLFAPRVLAAAGLHDASERALRPLAARVANVDDRIAVARLYLASRDYHRAQSMLVAAYAEPLARGVAAGQEELWRLAWPDAFATDRQRARPPGAVVDPWFVASIMREESGYRPDAVSVSGAVGLLQLMPDTAARLAREAGVAGFAPSQLVRPELNLRLGTLFLDQLTRRFDGALEAAAASYNAGPDAVTSWRTGAARPADVWVESIPYDETRGYVKRAMRSLHVYRSLYP
jgi:soluble lytic murein transglycosylase